MKLTDQQKERFRQDGFVRVRNAIPLELLDPALRAINHSVGEGISAEEILRTRSTSYCKELQNDPVILDLLHESAAWQLVQSAIGEGKVQRAKSGQIALRFPASKLEPRAPWPHLDGMHTPNNGVPEGVIRNFTMLVGIALSDVPKPYSGNLSVWPGTHYVYEEYFREKTPQSLLCGMPEVTLPESQQLTVEKGDLLLVHYQVAHGAAVNLSPNVRYAVYFRLKHVDHDRDPWGAMTDIWRDWEGMNGEV